MFQYFFTSFYKVFGSLMSQCGLRAKLWTFGNDFREFRVHGWIQQACEFACRTVTFPPTPTAYLFHFLTRVDHFIFKLEWRFRFCVSYIDYHNFRTFLISDKALLSEIGYVCDLWGLYFLTLQDWFFLVLSEIECPKSVVPKFNSPKFWVINVCWFICFF